MPPPRLVLDTNIVVSAALMPSGLQRAVFARTIDRVARLYVSEAVLNEYSGAKMGLFFGIVNTFQGIAHLF
jgi:predicted nucleic acid-binding protein